MNMTIRLAASVAVLAVSGAVLARSEGSNDPDKRAEATLRQMTPAEKTVLTSGIMPLPFGPAGAHVPADAIAGAGYVPGIPRLDIPALKETDASLGVAWVGGIRGDGATPLPSGLAQAATWNPELIRKGGAMIGAEARAKGFNVLLGGGVNLMRDPRNGRSFEYLAEDPLLSGVLAGNAIAGIQSAGLIATIKHFALNGQETQRKLADVRISDAAARESDLLAFQIGIEIGQPGSVMCSYNPVNGAPACASDYLLNKVLKQDWRYKGFVMSDWGSVPGLQAARAGLDQQSAGELDAARFFGEPLAKAAGSDPQMVARLDDMNRRILRAIYAAGLDRNPASPGGKIDFAAHGAITEEVARQGIVLLRNEGNVLPLARTARRIALIGGYASIGVLSGGGSSQVQAPGGPAAVIPGGVEGPFAATFAQAYHRSSPMKAIKALAPQAQVTWRDGSTISEAVDQAKKADVAIIFATKWSTEGQDQADLTLPNGQDALIAAVAAANPRTIVVLETGNPVLMPWLEHTPGVLQAWFPGGRGGEAIAAILFGEANPSGRLPVTFPASEAQLPRPVVDGFFQYEPRFTGDDPAAAGMTINYAIEGSDLGYRWNARQGHKALFPFGYGLSYTRFASDGLSVNGRSASFTVRNTGERAGATVAQLYLVSRNGARKQRLVGFQRVELAPGAARRVTLSIDPRLLADWQEGGWSIAGGNYGFALGDNAEALGPTVTVKIAGRKWRD